MFLLDLADESNGMRRIMALAIGVEQVLSRGEILFVDEID